MSLIAVEDLVVERGGRRILDVGSLAVDRGELLVVLGPTGAGKSTLLRVLNLLERPAAGCVRWRDRPVACPPPLAVRRMITMVFQDPLLLSGSVAGNVAYGLSVRGVGRVERRRRVAEILAVLRIGDLAARRAHTLSGGEAQRAALARALVIGPDLLLLDEPFAALDAPVRDQLRIELRDILKRRGTTCVFVTHDQDEAWAMADRVAVLAAGGLVQVGSRDDVFHRPATRFVAEFVRTGNVLPGRMVVPGEVDLGRIRLPLVPPATGSGEVLVCIRAERVGVTAAANAGRGSFPARVHAVEDLGATIRLTLDAGVPLVALVTRGVAESLAPLAGREVFATIDPAGVHIVRRTEES